MNRKVVKKNNLSYKVVIFWTIFALLSISFVGLVVNKFFESRPETSLESVRNLTENQIFEQEGTYYVYVYSIVGVTEDKYELDKAEDLEETILTYLTYVKRNPETNKMYGMIVDSGAGTYGNYSSLIDGEGLTTDVVGKSSFSGLKIHKNDLPILLKFENGKVKSAYLTESDIRKELQFAMNPE